MARPKTIWTVEMFYRKTKSAGNCLLWTGSKNSGTGYGQTYYEGRNIGAHRLAWILNHGKIPRGLCVIHTCDIKLCVSINHIVLGTYQDNSDDMNRKGRQWHRGSLHQHAKTNEVEVARIRRDWSTGKYTKMDLVRKYNLSHPTIRRILARRIWRHVG